MWSFASSSGVLSLLVRPKDCNNLLTETFKQRTDVTLPPRKAKYNLGDPAYYICARVSSNSGFCHACN